MSRIPKYFEVAKIQRDNIHAREIVRGFDNRAHAERLFDSLKERLTPAEVEAGVGYEIRRTTREVARTYGPPRRRKAPTKQRGRRGR
jgi:hypothetical protein